MERKKLGSFSVGELCAQIPHIHHAPAHTHRETYTKAGLVSPWVFPTAASMKNLHRSDLIGYFEPVSDLGMFLKSWDPSVLFAMSAFTFDTQKMLCVQKHLRKKPTLVCLSTHRYLTLAFNTQNSLTLGHLFSLMPLSWDSSRSESRQLIFLCVSSQDT